MSLIFLQFENRKRQVILWNFYFYLIHGTNCVFKLHVPSKVIQSIKLSWYVILTFDLVKLVDCLLKGVCKCCGSGIYHIQGLKGIHVIYMHTNRGLCANIPWSASQVYSLDLICVGTSLCGLYPKMVGHSTHGKNGKVVMICWLINLRTACFFWPWIYQNF